MLERTIVSSASIWPACSCFKSHVVKFSISYLLFLIAVGAAAGAAASISTALQLILRLKLAVAFGCLPPCEQWRWKGDRRPMEGEAELRVFHRKVGTASAIPSLSLSL